MPNNNQLYRNPNNQGGNPNDWSSRWSNTLGRNDGRNSGGNNNYGGSNSSWDNRGNNNQGGNSGWNNNQGWNNDQRLSPFAGHHHPTMVHDIPYRGVRQGQVSAQQYRGVAVLYDGTDAVSLPRGLY